MKNSKNSPQTPPKNPQRNPQRNPMANPMTNSNEYQAPLVRPGTQTPEETDPAKMIPINGFGQILDMLKAADPAFRESLLRRVAAKDARLAQSLIQGLRAVHNS